MSQAALGERRGVIFIVWRFGCLVGVRRRQRTSSTMKGEDIGKKSRDVSTAMQPVSTHSTHTICLPTSYLPINVLTSELPAPICSCRPCPRGPREDSGRQGLVAIISRHGTEDCGVVRSKVTLPNSKGCMGEQQQQQQRRQRGHLWRHTVARTAGRVPAERLDQPRADFPGRGDLTGRLRRGPFPPAAVCRLPSAVTLCWYTVQELHTRSSSSGRARQVGTHSRATMASCPAPRVTQSAPRRRERAFFYRRDGRRWSGSQVGAHSRPASGGPARPDAETREPRGTRELCMLVAMLLLGGQPARPAGLSVGCSHSLPVLDGSIFPLLVASAGCNLLGKQPYTVLYTLRVLQRHPSCQVRTGKEPDRWRRLCGKAGSAVGVVHTPDSAV